MGVHAVRINPKSKLGLFISHVMPGVVRPMRVLWNEIIGFLFLVLAIMATPSVIRTYRQLDQPQGGLGRLLLGVLFVAVMAYFGISSFLRARRISRSESVR